MPSSGTRLNTDSFPFLLARHGLDDRAQALEFFNHIFVAALDVLHAANFGLALRSERGANQSRSRAQVGRSHRSPHESGYALYHGGPAILFDVRAHPRQLV